MNIYFLIVCNLQATAYVCTIVATMCMYLVNSHSQTVEYHLGLFLQQCDQIRKRLTHAFVSSQIGIIHQNAALTLNLILCTNTQELSL